MRCCEHKLLWIFFNIYELDIVSGNFEPTFNFQDIKVSTQIGDPRLPTSSSNIYPVVFE